jgi:hypothetical protein
VVELLPPRDVNGLTALTAVRLLMLLAASRGREPIPRRSSPPCARGARR